MCTREICKACWEINRIGFSVPDEIWNAAVPVKLRDSILCLNCFTRFADEQLIPWDAQIKFFPVSAKTHFRQFKCM